MIRTVLTDVELKEMFANGYRSLCRAEKQINDLNVFPIPDGDTGTNMVKTLGGGVFSASLGNGTMSEFMNSFSRAVLFNARGNSGVILSQFIRGFASGCDDNEILDINGFCNAFSAGVEKAYAAVIEPVEGTMLTVIREAAEALNKAEGITNFHEALAFIIDEMKVSLKHTPDKLPVLKEAGVVDSGGLGIIYIFEGMKAYIEGDIIETDDAPDIYISSLGSTFGPDSVLEYGYCTEFILQLMNYKTNIAEFTRDDVVAFLETIGDSIVAVQDEDILKVHVHTFEPEKALAYARRFGEFVSVKIENMSIQHNESFEEKKKHYKYAVVGVATGDGIKQYFKDIGVAEIIDGGQTNNPSAQNFIDVFNSLDAEHIVVLPNNSNIILTAMQAKDMCMDKDIRVIPTKSVAEGYSAISMMDMTASDIDEFLDSMTAFLSGVTAASITLAVSDAQMNGVKVAAGEYIAIVNGKIVAAAKDRYDVIILMLQSLPDIDEKQVITMFSGKGVSTEDAQIIVEKIKEKYPLIEVGNICGGQDIYDFYMAIE